MLNKKIAKQSLLQAIDELSSYFTINELLNKLIFIDKVNEGLQQSLDSKTFSKKEIEEKINYRIK